MNDNDDKRATITECLIEADANLQNCQTCHLIKKIILSLVISDKFLGMGSSFRFYLALIKLKNFFEVQNDRIRSA